MKRFISILTALFIVTSMTMPIVLKAGNFQGLAKTKTESGTFLRQRKTFGDGVAAYSLGQFDKAKAIWMSLADEGHSEAAFRLAMMLDRDPTPDKALVLKYYSQAMLAGYDEAIIPWFKLINGLNKNDKPLSPDEGDNLTLALNKLRQLAKENNGPALVELGLCLVNENCGIDADYPQALKLFKRAIKSDLRSYSKDRVIQYITMLEKALGAQ